MNYIVKHTSVPAALDGDFENDPQWSEANVMEISNRMYPKYNIFMKLWRAMTGKAKQEALDPYAPETRLKLLYDEQFIYGLFEVKDQYVRATQSEYGQQACIDSCVEFFIRPQNNIRYYNFEFTAGGHILLYNITHLRRRQFVPVAESDCKEVKIYHSMPSIVDPEITEPVTWRLGFAIPIALFVKLGYNVDSNLSGQTWTANAYKCGDETSHPHWYTWNPLPKLDFHLPEHFGTLYFE